MLSSAISQKSADLFNRLSLHSKCHTIARCTRQCDFIYVHKKKGPSLRRFYETKTIDNIMRRLLISKIIQNRQSISISRPEIHLRPKVKYGFHCSDFYKIRCHSVKVCGHYCSDYAQFRRKVYEIYATPHFQP
jgi:hypothetical protein